MKTKFIVKRVNNKIDEETKKNYLFSKGNELLKFIDGTEFNTQDEALNEVNRILSEEDGAVMTGAIYDNDHVISYIPLVIYDITD